MDFLKGITPRKYQQKIFETCIKKNCLVVLPTGLGKTLIALMLTIKRMQEFPGEKVVFLAPTKPLTEQHLEFFQKHLPELFADIQLFTGAVKADQRKKIWQTADIIFSTPQCVANDLKKNLYNLEEVCLLVEDEAHRCIKNYDYNFIAKKYKEQSKNQRIIGLTASPGSEITKIKEICKNLSIEEVELRTRESIDVKEYLQELEFEKIMIDFPPELEEIRHVLTKLFNKYVEELKKRKVLWTFPSKIKLIELQKKLMAGIARGNKNFNYMIGISACAQAIKIQHSLELLETQTLSGFNKYLKELLNQATKKQSKGVVKLVAKPEFNFAFMQSNELLAKDLEHPKVKKILNIVEREISNKNNTKIIIFTQFRETATTICKKLNEIEKVKAKVFVGQAKKNGSGLSQKEQKKIINEFSTGEINILCATSLHPDELIILKNKGNIKIKTIKEFSNMFLKKEKNSKKIQGWEALSSDGKKTFFKPITHVHRHLSKNNLVNVKLSSGFETKITKDHELFTFEKDRQFVKTSPLLNKFIALPIQTCNIEKEQKINLEKEFLLKNTNFIQKHIINLNQAKIRKIKTNLKVLLELNKKELSIQKIADKTKKDYSTILNCLKRIKNKEYILQKTTKRNNKKISQITSLGKEYLVSIKWLLENIKYSKGKYKIKISKKTPKKFNQFFEEKINIKYGKIHFPKEINLTKELAEFLGFYVSESHSRKTKKTSGIFLASQNPKIRKLMQKSIKKGLNVEPSTTKNGIAVYSQLLHHLIEHVFKAGIGTYNKEIPEIIFTSKNEIKWAFLNAYFLGDGHINKNKDRIVLTTVSKKLVTGLIFLLRSLGIQKITLNKQENIFRINIFESLPFAKIKEKNLKKSKSYYSLIPKALESKKIFDKYSNFYFPKTRKIGKWKDEIAYDYIKEVKEVKNPDFVYDITVKDTKNFIGGTGLICLHNCIAEEGLDIPEVNSVIFYESVPSAIRAIQRAGRTARLTKGKLILLITKKTRDEAFYYVSRSREKSMKTAIDKIKDELKNNKKLEFQEKL
ncbi:DEAD/DEAH box helicase [Candidatus Pacearchaeota archaeon]|nr:DEAD/DEAH box helicase [Candidatus Pacearchaeota archaeon]